MCSDILSCVALPCRGVFCTHSTDQHGSQFSIIFNMKSAFSHFIGFSFKRVCKNEPDSPISYIREGGGGGLLLDSYQYIPTSAIQFAIRQCYIKVRVWYRKKEKKSKAIV